MDVAGAGVEERFPAVVGNGCSETEDVDALIVVRIDAHLAEVEAARTQIADARPVRAGVVAAKHTAASAPNSFQ